MNLTFELIYIENKKFFNGLAGFIIKQFNIFYF